MYFSCSFHYSSATSYESDPESSSFEPIPALKFTDADVTLLFLSANNISFSVDAVEDPWYSANSYPFVDDGNTTFYSADDPVRVLACVERQQWCNAERQETSGDGCRSLSGIFTSSENVLDLWDTDRQRRAFDWNTKVMVNVPNIETIVNGLREASLLASQSLYTGYSAPLKKTQWELEMEYWFQMRLAAVQQASVDAAEGPKEEKMFELLQKPQDKESRRICGSQVSYNCRAIRDRG